VQMTARGPLVHEDAVVVVEAELGINQRDQIRQNLG
jgi:hypothetical protein